MKIKYNSVLPYKKRLETTGLDKQNIEIEDQFSIQLAIASTNKILPLFETPALLKGFKQNLCLLLLSSHL